MAVAASVLGAQCLCDFPSPFLFLCEGHVLDQVCLLGERYSCVDGPMVRVDVFFVTNAVGQGLLVADVVDESLLSSGTQARPRIVPGGVCFAGPCVDGPKFVFMQVFQEVNCSLVDTMAIAKFSCESVGHVIQVGKFHIRINTFNDPSCRHLLLQSLNGVRIVNNGAVVLGVVEFFFVFSWR